MPRQTKGRPKRGVNISVSAAERAAIEARARADWKSKVAVVCDAVKWVLDLDERGYAKAVGGLVPDKDSVLYVELPAPLFARAAAVVGPDGVAHLCRKACISYLSASAEVPA